MNNFENENNIPQAPDNQEPQMNTEQPNIEQQMHTEQPHAEQQMHTEQSHTEQQMHTEQPHTEQQMHTEQPHVQQQTYRPYMTGQGYTQPGQNLYRYKYTQGMPGQNVYYTNPQAEARAAAEAHAQGPAPTPENEAPKAKVKKTKVKKQKAKKAKSGIGKKFAITVAAAVIFGIVAGGVFQGVRYGTDLLLDKNETETTTEQTTESEESESILTTSTGTVDTVYDVSEVAELVMPSIVAINGTYLTTYEYWFQTYEQESTGAGSGIIIGEDDEYLYIVTNYHVVEDSTELSVTFIDDEAVDATVKSYDEDNDLAIVLVELSDIKSSTKEEIKPITIGSSDDLTVGTPCVAIGNALGYGQSVTVGYVSALEREISVSDGTITVLQTDAAINPGNSGGALVNMQGELIGINTAKYVDSQVEGMGYALPISNVQEIIDYLIDNDQEEIVSSQGDDAYLGIEPVEITSEYSSSFGMPAGVYIKSVLSDTPAEDAGLQTGDIITAIDDETISSTEDLHEILAKHSPGDKIEVTYYRNDGRDYMSSTVTVTLGSKPTNS